MSKAKIYGLKSKFNQRLLLDMRYREKQRRRNREKQTPKPVAGQIVKGKEVK